MTHFFLCLLFSSLALAQAPLPPEVKPSEAPKEENKVDVLYRLARLFVSNSAANNFFTVELEAKKSKFPKELWPTIKEAGELTQKGFFFEDKIKKALHASMTLKELSEVEAYFNDPKLSQVRDTTFILKEDLDSKSDKGQVISEYLKDLPRNTPRRSYLYLIDSEIYRHSEKRFHVARFEAIMNLEVASLDASKNRKSELAFKLKTELEKLSAKILEDQLDESTYIYQYISFDDLKNFYFSSRVPAVLKFYGIIHSTLTEGLLELGKKFGQKLRETHRAKTHPKI